MLRVASSGVGRFVGRQLLRTVRTGAPLLRWWMEEGPFFANVLSQLDLGPDEARHTIEQAQPDDAGDASLVHCVSVAL